MYKVTAYVDKQRIKKKLSWADFKGVANEESKYYAFTYWNVEYSFEYLMNDLPEVVVTIWNKVSPNSWVKPQAKTRELLKHEKGHFAISKILALRFREHLHGSWLDTNFDAVVEELFMRLHQEALQLEKRYDEETNHFKNKEAQRLWDFYLSQSLDALMAKI